MSLDLKALAAEREARLRASGGLPASSTSARPRSTTPMAPPKPAQQQASGAAARPASASRSAPSALSKAHRSIRMAHTLALAVELACLLSLALFGLGKTAAFVMLLAFGFARSGGTVLHSLLPANLREGPAPSPAEVDAASKGAFGPGLLASPADALSDEYRAGVENLAFACTFGKKNCLTNDMYSGELSLGKICSLVGAKLADGTIRCA